MKKLLWAAITVVLVVVSFSFAVSVASATDVCSDTPLETADFYVETSRASWLMSQSCVDSSIVVTMPQGSVMHVIGKTEGWHKLITEDGYTGWMWEDFVTSTSKTFNPLISEPDPVVTYDPMYDISGHKYEDAVWYVYNKGIVGGYEDGSYQPDRTINRAELLKIIVEAAYNDSDFAGYAGQSCFTDVAANQWYTKYICFAKQEGIVEGYTDGSFKPEQEINFVEALKIAVIGFGYEYTEGDPWYKNIVNHASPNKLIPLDIFAFNQAFKRGQMADMITRIMKYEDGTLDAYTGTGDTTYYPTYYSIEAGINVEDYVGTGKCIYYGSVLENGEADDSNGYFCDNGSLISFDI